MPRIIIRMLALVLLGPAAALILADSLVVRPYGTALAETEGGGRVRSQLLDRTVTVYADDASVPDVIEDLARTLGFDVHGDAPGKDLRITRKLEGRLDHLLAQLLRGANYLVVTEAGAPKCLIILQAGAAVVQPFASMSIEQLRNKAGELVAQVAQYEDLSQEARERSNAELARKFERHVSELSMDMAAIRARISP